MSLITTEIESFIQRLLLDPTTPTVVKGWIASELGLSRPKIAAARAAMKTVLDDTKSNAVRRAALKTLIDYYTQELT